MKAALKSLRTIAFVLTVVIGSIVLLYIAGVVYNSLIN